MRRSFPEGFHSGYRAPKLPRTARAQGLRVLRGFLGDSAGALKFQAGEPASQAELAHLGP